MASLIFLNEEKMRMSATTDERPAFRDEFPLDEATRPEASACETCGQHYTMYDVRYGHVSGEYVPHPRLPRNPD